MKKVIMIILSALALMSSLSACSQQEKALDQTQPETLPTEQITASMQEATQPAIALPDFMVADGAGGSASLQSFAGAPVVLHFWTVGEESCTEELPSFERAAQNNENVRFLMILATDGVAETVEKGQTFIYDNGYTFPVFYDIEGEAVWACDIQQVPATIFIDMFGNVVQKTTGAMTADQLETGLELIR